MNGRVWLVALKASSTALAMVLIWMLVKTALDAGIDGVIFVAGVIAIAGLGGYEMRWIIEAIKKKKSKEGGSGS